MRAHPRVAFAILTLVIVAACGLGTLDLQPHAVRIVSNKLVTVVGDTLQFTVDATGGSLLNIEMVFDDGETDLFAANGSRTVHAVFKHAYKTRGIYIVEAAAVDATEGAKKATVEIRVN